jgi:hypothetical protein
MYSTLLIWAAGFMLVLLFMNVYIRMKVLVIYQKLQRKKVEFPAKYILDKKRLEAEVIPRYPDSADDIRAFGKQIQISLRIASVLLMGITLLAAVLYYYKEN